MFVLFYSETHTLSYVDISLSLSFSLLSNTYLNGMLISPARHRMWEGGGDPGQAPGSKLSKFWTFCSHPVHVWPLLAIDKTQSFKASFWTRAPITLKTSEANYFKGPSFAGAPFWWKFNMDFSTSEVLNKILLIVKLGQFLSSNKGQKTWLFHFSERGRRSWRGAAE